MKVWVWRDTDGTLRWGETADFRHALSEVARRSRTDGNMMLDGARNIERKDVPYFFERYHAEEGL